MAVVGPDMDIDQPAGHGPLGIAGCLEFRLAAAPSPCTASIGISLWPCTPASTVNPGSHSAAWLAAMPALCSGAPMTSPPSGANDDKVILYTTDDANSIPHVKTTLTPDSDTRCKEIHCDCRPVIPVIFIPGMMGSQLRNHDGGDPIWHAPNLDQIGSAIAGVLAVIGDYFQSASKREKRLDPTMAIVDPSGPIHVDHHGSPDDVSEEQARHRGWGTIHRTSYHPTLNWLQQTLNNPLAYGVPDGIWAHGDPDGDDAPRDPTLGTDPASYGAYGVDGRPANSPILTADSEVFKRFVKYSYRVYAIGYNFLQSNEASARDVLTGVDVQTKPNDDTSWVRVMGIREICRECCTDQAILMTHPMGGLVARIASEFCGGADSILGVVHGAQPATGARLFAKRFRTGGESFVNKSLLGRDDAEFVAVAANAEGPLELAPMPDYHDGLPWWHFLDRQGKPCMSLPHDSALDEIYRQDSWYGLLPDHSMIDPAGIVKDRLTRNGQPADVYQNYLKTIAAVFARQKKLFNAYHRNTYAIYGDGPLAPAMADKYKHQAEKTGHLESWSQVIWQGDLPASTSEADLKAAHLVHDNHHGELTIVVRGKTVKLVAQKQALPFSTSSRRAAADKEAGLPPDMAGDGTVPTLSAEAQARGILPGLKKQAKGVQLIFAQGGYGHQYCFDKPWMRWAVLYSMAQLVYKAKPAKS